MSNPNGQRIWKGIKPTPEDLAQIREDHLNWLESDQEFGPPHNLSGAKLQNANLSEFHLDRIDLSWADLAEADIQKASLINANLKHAQLQMAKMQRTYMNPAELNCADLQGAKLHDAKLDGAKLVDTDLRNAELMNAQLREADLTEAKMIGTNLNGAILSGANLTGAKLINAKMNSAIVSDAKLIGANLSVADLMGANLVEADLSKADLTGTDLERARVTDVRYKRLKSCRGIKAESCFGSPLFRRHVMDKDYIEDMRASKWGWLYWPWLFTSNCGRSFSLWVLWSIVFALFFAVVYLRLGAYAFEYGPKLDFDLPLAIYYSVVTFTTLGFGDVTPVTTTAQMWVMAEVILGYIMLGGLISIFANKFARRAG